MPRLPEHRDPDKLNDRLRGTDAVTAELISEVIGATCRRFPSIGQTRKKVQIERFIGSRAWTDAALTLIDLELSQWKVRRIAYDGGEWYCAPSRERELPDWLSRSIEAHHVDFPLSILSAFVKAQRRAPWSGTSVPTVPRDANPLFERFCCDNLA